MMQRYKWYRLGLPITLKQLTQRLTRLAFNADTTRGFIFFDDETHGKSFRFAWRSKLAQTSFDEDGLPVVDFVSTVSFCDFQLLKHEEAFYLRAKDPPRSLKELMNGLEEAVGFGFYVEPITFKKSVLPPTLQKTGSYSLIGFKAIGSLPNQHAVTRVEVASKVGLVLKELDFLRSMTYALDYSIYEIIYQRVKGQISISASGMVKISGQLAPLILNVIESDLFKANK